MCIIIIDTSKMTEEEKLAVYESEINLSKDNNFYSVTLGKRILRTETAPLVISSNIIYELED